MIILQNDFDSGMGIVRSWIKTGNAERVTSNNQMEFISNGHKIRLQTFEPPNERLERLTVERSNCWRWFIEKINDEEEKLSVYCRLINPKSDMSFGGDSGQYMEAIEIENDTKHMHLNTEDYEALYHRAIENDWMPQRFKEQLGGDNPDSLGLIKNIQFGFKISVPELLKGEKIYFHFICATNSIKQHIDYIDERDCSTWYAVGWQKKVLDDFKPLPAG
jgi:hypothetical protein